MKSMRSWLFVPGHRQRMIDKALGLPADVLIFDLEDGVPEAEKDVARSRVAAALDVARGGPTRFVRVHDAGSSELDADLQVVARAGLQGLVLPKVQGPEVVLQVCRWLDRHETRAGIPSGGVRLLATIESARGLVQAPAIASVTSRLVGLCSAQRISRWIWAFFRTRDRDWSTTPDRRWRWLRQADKSGL